MLEMIRHPRMGRLTPIVWLLLALIACLLVPIVGDLFLIASVTCVRVETNEVNCVTEKKVLALFPVGKPDTYLQVQRAIYGNSCELIESEYCSEWIDVETAQDRTKLMAIGMFAPADIANQINAMIT